MFANRTGRWSLATAIVCIALLAASWFLLVSPRRASAAETRVQSAAAQSQADLLQVKINQLRVQYADLPKRRAELDAIRHELPADAAIPTLVRNLQTYAAQAGVTLDTLAPGSPGLVTAEGAPAAAGASAGASSTAPQLVGIPMTLTINGDYFEASLFIKYLQTKLDRALLISAVSVAKGSETATPASTATATTATSTATPTVAATTAATTVADSDRVAVTITGSIFVLLDGTSTLADVAKAAKAAALGTSTATPTPTTAPTAN
jgi:Tfp pilus assembly protein PilO